MCDVIVHQIEKSKIFREAFKRIFKGFLKYLCAGSITFILIGIGIWLMVTNKIVIGVGIFAIVVLTFILINSFLN